MQHYRPGCITTTAVSEVQHTVTFWRDVILIPTHTHTLRAAQELSRRLLWAGREDKIRSSQSPRWIKTSWILGENMPKCLAGCFKRQKKKKWKKKHGGTKRRLRRGTLFTLKQQTGRQKSEKKDQRHRSALTSKEKEPLSYQLQWKKVCPNCLLAVLERKKKAVQAITCLLHHPNDLEKLTGNTTYTSLEPHYSLENLLCAWMSQQCHVITLLVITLLCQLLLRPRLKPQSTQDH